MRKGFMGLLGVLFIIFIILVAAGYLAVNVGTPRIDFGKMVFPESSQSFINNSNFSNTTENIRTG
jgi:hypothetical protein